MLQRTTIDLHSVVRNVMAECGNDRDRAITLLIDRDDDTLVNEAFRALGIKQAVRSFQTSSRSFTGGTSSEEYTGNGGSHPTGARRPLPADARKKVDDDPKVQKARQAVKDVIGAFMEMHTLFGGRVNLVNATHPDFKRSVDSYGAQEAGAKRMRLFHTDCMNELPEKSFVATLPVSKYPTIFKHAQNRGIIDP